MFTLISTAKFFFPGFAKALNDKNLLSKMYIGYPNIKLNELSSIKEKLRTFPFIHTPLVLLNRWNLSGNSVNNYLEFLDSKSISAYASLRYDNLSNVISMSSMGLEINPKVRKAGFSHIICRSSRHILDQREILIKEKEKWGYPIRVPNERIVERELAEYSMADLIIVPSLICMSSFRNRGVNMEKVKLVYFPSALNNFKRHNFTSNGHKLILTFVGQVNLRKGIPTLLQAFKKINNKNIELYLIGSIDHKFQKYLQDANLMSDGIKITGHLNSEQIRKILNKTSIFIMPSVEEGWPLALMEAISVGCVPIVSNAVCQIEEIPNQDERLIFDAGNESQLADKIQYFIDTPFELHKIAEAMNKQAPLNRNWSDFTKDFLDAFNSLPV